MSELNPVSLAMSRSFHFVPAHRSSFLEKIPKLEADRIVLELEDGVGEQDKDEARRNIFEFLSVNEVSRFLVRVNPFGSAQGEEDFKMLSQLKSIPELVIPKVESSEVVGKILSSSDRLKSVKVLALIESFSGLAQCRSIAELPQVSGLGIGMEDLMSETVHSSTQLEKLVSSVQSEVILAARAKGKLAIDSISTIVDDELQFRSACECSRSHGFHGRFLIHPSQISVANEVYAPDEKMRQWAKEVLRLSNGNEHGGYQRCEGRVISGPMVLKAKAIFKQIEKIK